MNNLTFNTTKLNEVCDLLSAYYCEYKDIITALEQEMSKLETTWGNNNQSAYRTFKEKYEEKKPKLIETDNMMKELLDTLETKKDEIQSIATQTENSFE